jgi:hypothetical protein
MSFELGAIASKLTVDLQPNLQGLAKAMAAGQDFAKASQQANTRAAATTKVLTTKKKGTPPLHGAVASGNYFSRHLRMARIN